MRLYLYLAALIAAVLAGVAGWMWWVQNSLQTVNLSFRLTENLAWELTNEVSTPALIAVAFGSGLVFGAGVLFMSRMRLAAENRRLRQEIALSGNSKSSKDW
jgi:hypothetical protein